MCTPQTRLLEAAKQARAVLITALADYENFYGLVGQTGSRSEIDLSRAAIDVLRRRINSLDQAIKDVELSTDDQPKKLFGYPVMVSDSIPENEIRLILAGPAAQDLLNKIASYFYVTGDGESEPVGLIRPQDLEHE